MKLRPRLDALEARTKPEGADLRVCATIEEAAAHVARTPSATIIITGVPRAPKEARQ